MRLPGLFGISSIVLRDRRKASDPVSSSWHAGAVLFVHIAKTLARWFQTSCFVACAVFSELDNVLKGSKISFCEIVVIFDSVHDDDFAWQALRMPETNFLWQSQCSRDLDEKLVETM